jgi:hypothetical protein
MVGRSTTERTYECGLMCGICGFVGEPDGVDSTAMLKSLVHRGPGGHGEWRESMPESTVWLGHHRLAILDLSPAGTQPLELGDQQLAMSFNGEIYNHADINVRHWLGRQLSNANAGRVQLHGAGRSDASGSPAPWSASLYRCATARDVEGRRGAPDSNLGSSSIPPERLFRTLLLQVFYSVRSESPQERLDTPETRDDTSRSLGNAVVGAVQEGKRCTN